MIAPGTMGIAYLVDGYARIWFWKMVKLPSLIWRAWVHEGKQTKIVVAELI